MDDHVNFCPDCGAKLVENNSWVCNGCGTENDAGSHFCKNCGVSRDEQNEHKDSVKDKIVEFSHTKNFRYMVVGIIMMFAIAGGSYYYFNNMNEGHYLAYYAEASRTINDTNEIVVSNVKTGVLTNDSAGDIKGKLQTQKDAIDNLSKRFTEKHAFKNYESQHKSMIDILQKESSMLDETILVISKPLEKNTDELIGKVKDDIDGIKELSSQMDVPNTTLISGTDLSVVPQQLTVFVAEQKKFDEEKQRLEKEKKERQAAMNEFFSKMDTYIQDYDNAKDDLGTLLESSRKGSIMWTDYFGMINRAKFSRQGIKYQVNKLQTPAGAEEVKKQFIGVLAESIRYCELMSMGANLEYNNHYPSAVLKYNDAKKVNEQVQNDYTSFTSSYTSEKERLMAK